VKNANRTQVALLMQAEGGVSGIRLSSCFHHHHEAEGDEGETAEVAEEQETNEDDADGPRNYFQVASFIKV